MLHLNMRVFDEVITADLVTLLYPTGIQFAELLGRYDQLALQLIADNVASAGGPAPQLGLRLETSCDGETFTSKGVVIGSASLTRGATNVLVGADNGVIPSGYYVRFVLQFSSGALGFVASAHVRLFVSGRDRGGVHARLPPGKYVVPPPGPFPPYKYEQLACDSVCKQIAENARLSHKAPPDPKVCGAKCKSCMTGCYKKKHGSSWREMAACVPDCVCELVPAACL